MILITYYSNQVSEVDIGYGGLSDAYPQFLSWLQSIAFRHNTNGTTTRGIRGFCHTEDFLVGKVVSPVHDSPTNVNGARLAGKFEGCLHDYSTSISDIAIDQIPDDHSVFFGLVLGRI